MAAPSMPWDLAGQRDEYRDGANDELEAVVDFLRQLEVDISRGVADVTLDLVCDRLLRKEHRQRFVR
jgi:hypothetical protein